MIIRVNKEINRFRFFYFLYIAIWQLLFCYSVVSVEEKDFQNSIDSVIGKSNEVTISSNNSKKIDFHFKIQNEFESNSNVEKGKESFDNQFATYWRSISSRKLIANIHDQVKVNPHHFFSEIAIPRSPPL